MFTGESREESEPHPGTWEEADCSNHAHESRSRLWSGRLGENELSLEYVVFRYIKHAVTKSEYEILAAFRYELRKYLHFSEQAAQKEELSPQKYQALLAIQGFPGRSEVTIGELAEQLQIVPHSAVGLVDRLEGDGLILRQPSKEDRRCVFVKLTARGKTILEKLASVHRKELKTVGPLLTEFLARVSTGDNLSTREADIIQTTVRGCASDRGPFERRPNATPVCYAPEEV